MAVNNLLCSFCGRSNQEVDKLIAGPGVYICNECGDMTAEILSEVSSKSDILNVKSPEFQKRTVNDMLFVLEISANEPMISFLTKCRELQKVEIAKIPTRLVEINQELKELQAEKEAIETRIAAMEKKRDLLEERKG